MGVSNPEHSRSLWEESCMPSSVLALKGTH